MLLTRSLHRCSMLCLALLGFVSDGQLRYAMIPPNSDPRPSHHMELATAEHRVPLLSMATEVGTWIPIFAVDELIIDSEK